MSYSIWKYLVAVGVSLTSGISLAAWSSGGGQLIKDAHNPWFIQNTERVTYCIVRDAQHFKLNDDEGFPLETLVRNAIRFWQDEFETSYNPGGSFPGGVRVATQEFVQTSCAQDPDIKFQFGFLFPEQLREMRSQNINPRGYISLAVRTHYDLRNLRSKGFIYLAADSGALRPDSNEMQDHPWANGSGALIYKVLVHELGHVFGIQHQSHAMSVMAADYPENLVQKRDDGNHDTGGYSYYLPSFFKFSQPRDYWTCLNVDFQPVAVKFFGIPKEFTCYGMGLTSDRYVEIYAATGDFSTKEIIGHATLDEKEALRFDFPISVWLPDEQTVYPANTERILYGPMIKHVARKGVYRNRLNGLERQISFDLSPYIGWNKIGGVMDGKQFIDIQSNQ